jgi:hypothetical protein
MRAQPSASHTDVGTVLIVGWADAAAVWRRCSAECDLAAIQAGDVETALDMLGRLSPVAVILAWHFEASVVRRLCEEVRARHSRRYTPILVSGPDDPARHVEYASAIDGYVADEQSDLVSHQIRQWIALAIEVRDCVATRENARTDSGLRRRRTDGRRASTDVADKDG